MSSDPLPLPDQPELPLFVYGALKPGLPANERIDQFVERYEKDTIAGELQVRDGLPLALLNNSGLISGYVVHWQPGQEREGYDAVCSFEPRDHYVWGNVELNSGNAKANVLEIRHPNKGNPQHIFKPDWAIMDDPAFGEGLATVEDAIKEIEKNKRENIWSEWQLFFRAQMAYLLLWSILERLSALCFGPAANPMQRVKQLHELAGMAGLVETHVKREDSVCDSRDPRQDYKLNKDNTQSSFKYYYQVRSNLSHRGKAVPKEFDKVNESLKELCAITKDYLAGLSERNTRS